jgi:hypothetical protein
MKWIVLTDEKVRDIEARLQSIVVSLLGGNLLNENHVRIVVAELKFVVSAACNNRSMLIRGNIKPCYYNEY